MDIETRVIDLLTQVVQAYSELETNPAEAASFLSGIDGCRNLMVLRVADKTVIPPTVPPEPEKQVKPTNAPAITPSQTKRGNDGR